MNCFIKQLISTNQGLKKQLVGDCKGRKTTFGNCSSYAREATANRKQYNRKGQKPLIPANATKIEQVVNVPTKMDEDARALAETLNNLASFESDEIQLYGFSTLQVGISAENSSSSEDERKEPQNAHSDDNFF